MNKNEKIVIGWPDTGSVYTGFVAFMMQLLLHRRDKIEDVVIASGHYLSNNKNICVENFLKTGADWLLLMDCDVLVTLESFDTLIQSADKNNRPIVSGSYFLPMNDRLYLSGQYKNPEYPDAGFWISDWDKEIIDDLHSVGAGFLLVHKSVYKAIQENNVDKMPQWFQDEYWGYPYYCWISEDIYFCKKARDLGFNIAINTKATSTHLKNVRITEDNFVKIPQMIPMGMPAEKHTHPYGERRKMHWWIKGKSK
jgi:hypothetical protein